MNHVIDVSNVTKTYIVGDQEVNALKNVSLAVRQGLRIAITGCSGSGKTTLLHIIGTLDTPSSGDVVLVGQNMSNLTDAMVSRFRNQTVGFVFQMNNLLPEFTAVENVMMPGLIGGFDRKKIQERAVDLIRAVGLSHREGHRPSEMSGGEQQRVAIARSLLLKPPILLADEPTGNLDKKNSKAVVDLLMNLCESEQVTMLLVTHDQALADVFPQQIVMDDGQIIDRGGQW